METVAQPPVEAELNLLTDWGDAEGSARRRTAMVGTVLVHLAVIGGLVAVPPNVVEQPKPEPPRQHVTLLEPLTELTQKTLNKGKITKEFESRLELPRTAVQSPVSPPVTQPKPQAPRKAVIPETLAPKPQAPAPALPEPPRIDTSVKEQPRPELPTIAQSAPPPPPQIQTAEKPKLSLDNVPPPAAGPPPGQPRIAVPSTSVNDAIRDLGRQGSTTVIGDPGASGSGYGSITQSPTPGTPLANIELKFDPQGVDFVPYVRQVLATVKRNWMAVMPQSVKLGRRGKVVIQFSIRKDGVVDKLVYAQNSGADALDKAAVAGVSASAPFPPLPAQFKGDRIVLQLNFVYR